MAARDAVREIRAVLDRTRGDLLAMLSEDVPGVAPTEYDRFIAQSRVEAIDRALAQFEAEAVGTVSREIEAASRAAVQEVRRRLTAVTSPPPGLLIGVDIRTMEFVQDLAATQVRAVAEEVKAKIRGALQRAMAGGLTRVELEREIAKALGGDATMARVERIVRTETNQAFTQAEAAANEQLAETAVADDLIKVWRATKDGRTREEHLLVDGQERELDQLFSVGGGATAATPPGSGVGEQANAPLDPSLSAENAVNCRCTVVYIPRAEAKQPYIEKDPNKAAERRRRKGAAA